MFVLVSFTCIGDSYTLQDVNLLSIIVVHKTSYLTCYCYMMATLHPQHVSVIIPQYAEPRRHTVVILCVCVCVCACVCVCVFHVCFSVTAKRLVLKTST